MSTATQSVVARGIGVLKAGWQGLVGQAFTFSAMILPLFFHEFRGVSFQIVAGAGAGVLALFCTLAFSSVFPRIRDAQDLRISMWSTLAVLTLGALVCVTAGVVAKALHQAHLGDILWSWALMGACQGLYMIGAGASVRFSHYKSIAIGRLVYGFFVFFGALAACIVFSGSMWALTLSACIAQILAACGMWFGLRSELVEIMRLPHVSGAGANKVRTYVAETGHASVSTALTGLSGVMNVFILPTLGVFHDAWTTLLRLTGGVMTVSLQLVSPAFDAQVGESARAGDLESARGLARKELFTGLAIAAVTFVLSMGAMAFVRVFRGLSGPDSVTVVVLAFVYVAAGIGISVMTNTLLLLGGDQRRLVWAVCKTIAMGAAIAFGHRYVLHATVATEVVSAIVYVLLVRRQLKGFYAGQHRPKRS